MCVCAAGIFLTIVGNQKPRLPQKWTCICKACFFLHYWMHFTRRSLHRTVTVLQSREQESCNCLWSARKPLTSTALVSIQKTLLGDESLIESQPANDSILKQSGQSTHWPLSRITTNASPKHDGIAAVCWNRLLVHGANSALPLPSILQISLGNSSFITKAGLQPSLNPDQTGYAHMHARAVNTFTIKHNCHKDVACTVGVHVLT